MDQVSSDLRIEAYFDALHGIPSWAVKAAREAVVRGDTEFGRPWGPGPVEFAELCRVQVKPLLDDLKQIDTLLLAEPIERAVSENEKARVTAGFAKLKSDLAGKHKRSAHQVYEDAMRGLESRAMEIGVDFRTAFDSIPDTPPHRSGE